MLEFPGSCIPSVEAAIEQTQPRLSPPRLPQGNQWEMPKLTHEDERLPASMEPPRFPTAEKLASST